MKVSFIVEGGSGPGNRRSGSLPSLALGGRTAGLGDHMLALCAPSAGAGRRPRSPNRRGRFVSIPVTASPPIPPHAAPRLLAVGRGPLPPHAPIFSWWFPRPSSTRGGRPIPATRAAGRAAPRRRGVPSLERESQRAVAGGSAPSRDVDQQLTTTGATR